MISLRGIRKSYGNLTVLDGIDLDISPAEIVSIVGPSGAGKTTLLQILGTLDRPDSGTVSYDGQMVLDLPDNRLARFRNRNIGFVFQSFHLIPSLNIIDNVMVPLVYRSGAGDRRTLAREALERVGLSHRLHHMPSQLSGGQAQRVAIARAIVGNPRIILADEPCGNLDSHMGVEIMSLLHSLNRDEHRTIVMVTHNEEQARGTDRIVHMFDGRRVD